MKLSLANSLSLSRVVLGVAAAALPGSAAPDPVVARRVVTLTLAGLGTDLVDGAVARRHGDESNEVIDSLSDASLLLGLVVASTRLRFSYVRVIVAAALVPAYVASQLIKPRLSPANVKRIDQVHFFGSIAMISALEAELSHTAGLSARRVALAEAGVLALIGFTKRGRLIAALR